MKPLIALLTDQFTFAIFYGGFIALITLWAMALLTRRVRRLTNHVEGLQADLRVVNDALKALTSAPARREIGSIDGVLGVNSRPASSPGLTSEFARARPTLEVGGLDSKPAPDPSGALAATKPVSSLPSSPPVGAERPASEAKHHESSRHRPSAAALPTGAVRPSVAKTGDAPSIKAPAAEPSAGEANVGAPDAKPVPVKPQASAAKLAP